MALIPCLLDVVLIICIYSNEEYAALERTESVYSPLRSYHLPKGEKKHYQQQYADMYFARLAVLKPAAEKVALDAWDGFEVSHQQATISGLRSMTGG